MIEVVGNLWTYPADFRIITVNGARRYDGYAVMGRGCAREAASKYPTLARELGNKIKRQGNHVHFFRDLQLFTFPVKHHWNEQADLELIRRSVDEMLEREGSIRTYVMPRPGCGYGGLTWDQVRPLVEKLPDNFKVIDFPATVNGGWLIDG